MRLKMDEEPTVGIDIAPLIDCVFLLLIFFLVATTFKMTELEAQDAPKIEKQYMRELEEQLKVDLPEPAVSARPVREQNSVRLTINADGMFFAGKKPIGQNELHRTLRDIAAMDKSCHILIDVDRRAESQYLIQLLDLCAFEGLKNYGIHTRNTID
jgi:biopolymer transport protein ExbD